MKLLNYTLFLKDYNHFNRSMFTIKRLVAPLVFQSFCALFAIFLCVNIFFSIKRAYFQEYHFLILLLGILINSTLISVAGILFFIIISFLFGGHYSYLLNKGIDNNTSLIINQDKVIENCGSLSLEVKWSSVKDVYNTKHNFLIFISDYKAIVIPKRIFDKEEEKQDFWNLIQNHYKNAHNNS